MKITGVVRMFRRLEEKSKDRKIKKNIGKFYKCIVNDTLVDTSKKSFTV